MLNTLPASSSPGSLYVHARNKFNLCTMFIVDITIPNHTVTGSGSAVPLYTTYKLEDRYELVSWTRQPKKEAQLLNILIH